MFKINTNNKLINYYLSGAASVLKAVSVHMDSYLNYTIQAHLREVYVINVPYLSSYFDVVAFLLAVILSGTYAKSYNG